LAVSLAFGGADPALVPVADLHCDFLLQLSKKPGVDIVSADGDISLGNLQKGGYFAQLFAVFVYPKEDQLEPKGRAQVKAFKSRVIGASKGGIRQVTSHQELQQNLEHGVISGILAMEGADVLGADADNLDWYAEQGVKVLSLTWNSSNAFADGLEEKDPPPRGGLTAEGEKLLRAMERHQIAVDMSHAHRETFWDIITTFKGPVLATHSNARAVCDHKRNLDDEQLLAIAQKNGLVGLVYHSPFVGKSKRAEIRDFVAHLDYIDNIIGTDYVALGSDFDGNIRHPKGVENASHIPQLLGGFMKLGVSSDVAAAVGGRNFLRFWQQATTNYDSVPPLKWRPLRVKPVTPADKTEALYDRLSSTAYAVSSDKSGKLSANFEFTALGPGLCGVAVRVKGTDVTDVGIALSTKNATTAGKGRCPTDGSRCVVGFNAKSPVSSGSPAVTVTLSAEAAGGPFHLQVRDIIPIACVSAH